jgi:hypothetical protein
MSFRTASSRHLFCVASASILRPFSILSAASLLLAGCDWDIGQSVFHTTIAERMNDNLSGALRAPAPPVVNPDSFRFALFGDPQLGVDLRSYLGRFRQDAAVRGISFFSVLGDLTEDDVESERQAVKVGLDSVGVPYYCTLGNHDLYQADGWAWFKAAFGPSCHSVVVADRIKLLFLDTAEDELGQAQFDWLASELADDGRFTKIVCTHFPIYDGARPIMWRLGSSEERYRLLSLLAKYRVHSYVAGHIHGWRHIEIDSVNLFICAMPAGGMDYGIPGYLLFTWALGRLSWEHVEFEGAP